MEHQDFTSSEDRLRRTYPQIPWALPVSVTAGGRTGFACRYCIAFYGLRANEFEPMTWLACRDHIRRDHP